MKKLLAIGLAVAFVFGLATSVVLAGHVFVDGDGNYHETREFGEISDEIALTGEWTFEADWTHPSSPGVINNWVSLFDDSTFSEHAISPDGGYYGDGNPGLDLQTIVTYGASTIQDIADIQLRGFDFTFDAETGSYESTKHLKIWDSHNYYYGGCSGNDQVSDISANRDRATFQVTDTSDSLYVVGGSVEYMKPYSSSQVSGNNVYLDQEFSKSSPIESYVTSHFYASSHIVATAYFGYDAAGNIADLDWYGEATMDIKGNDRHDTLYARFVDDEADFYTQYGKNHPMYLDAHGDSAFNAAGNAQDVGDNGSPSFADPLPWWYEAPTDQWTFTGTDFEKYDGNSVNWLASYDMD